MYNLLITILLLTFAIQSCQRSEAAEADQATIAVGNTEVPDLLQRPERVRNGIEWDQVQRQYAEQLAELRRDPSDDEARLNLSYIYAGEARVTGEHGHYYPAALRVIDEALADGVADEDVRFRLLTAKAGILLSQHRFAEALEIGQQAVGINPYFAQTYGVLVDANVEMGDYEQAVAMADKMVSIRPDLRSYSRVSYLREIHGDLPGAIEAMDMAVKAGYPGYEATSWARLTLGELYEQAGEKEQARMQYELALQERPDYPFAMGKLANLKIEAGEYAEAEKMLKEAAAIIPEVGFYIDLARIYRATDRSEEFEKTMEEVMVMLQDDVDSGHTMNMEYADLYLELREDADKALEYAMIEYEDRPLNIDVNRLLARIYTAKGDAARARDHLQAAMRTQSQHPELKEIQSRLASM